MHALRPRRPAARRAAAPLLLAALVACAGGSDAPPGSRRAARCGEPGDTVLSLAVEQYLKSVQPTPRRFVVPVGGGSDSLPEGGQRALHGAGPTFLYPVDSTQRQRVESHLVSRGDWPTLLVALRGMRQDTDSSVVVRLGGRFVSGELDEQPVPTRAVRIACRANRWTYDRIDEERSS